MKSSAADPGHVIEVGIGLVLRHVGAQSKQNAIDIVGRSVDGRVSAPAAQQADQVLVTRRRDDTVYGGWWEFPGGKIEPGELPQACVVREVFEETGLAVEVVRQLGVVEHTYEHGRVRLHVCLCTPVDASAEPRAIDVAEARWWAIAGLDDLRLLPANGRVVELLREALLR